MKYIQEEKQNKFYSLRCKCYVKRKKSVYHESSDKPMDDGNFSDFGAAFLEIEGGKTFLMVVKGKVMKRFLISVDQQ